MAPMSMPPLCVPSPGPQSPDEGASVSVDIWSAGCIMAEMITGKTLFKGNDRILCLWGQAGWVAAGHIVWAGWGVVSPAPWPTLCS